MIKMTPEYYSEVISFPAEVVVFMTEETHVICLKET